MFASGIFIDSFSPKTEKETRSLIKAIKAFRADIVIVLEDMRLESKIRNEVQQMNQSSGATHQTLVYYMQKPQGVTANPTDEYSLFQNYFRGKNYKLILKQD